MLDDSPIVPVAIFGGAGLALYEFAYKPWAARRAVAAATAAAAKANLAKGMGIEEAAQNAIAGACVAAAVAKLHMTPDQAAPLCKGIGVLTEKGLKYAAKGAIVVGKEVGKGAVVAGKAVGKETVAAAKGTGQIIAAAASVPAAPVKQVLNVVRHPVTGVKNAVVTAVYRNPVSVGKTVVNAVTHPVSTVKSIVTAPLHPVDTVKKAASVAKKVLCFGFCDLGDADYLDGAEGAGRRARRRLAGTLAEAPAGNPFAVHARDRDRPAKRKPRSLAGLPAGGRRPRNSAAAGADFYLRHL